MIDFDTKIRFLISVPDGKPEEATPFQGFAFSLCEKAMFLRAIAEMPTDIFELTPEFLPHRIDRKISGQADVNWFGQSPRALRSAPMPIEAPFTIVVIDPSESLKDYREWIDSCPGPVTIVAEDNGSFRYEELSIQTLKKRFLQICDELDKVVGINGVAEAREAIQSWAELVEKELPYKIKGHGSVAPNVSTLHVCGYKSFHDENPLVPQEGDDPYVEQIFLTANTILSERQDRPNVLANRVYPKRPDINIYLPSTYDIKEVYSFNHITDRNLKRNVVENIRIIERQSGYKFDIKGKSQVEAILGAPLEALKDGGIPGFNPIMGVRQKEVWLGTNAVSCLSSSEIGAVIRLPNRMNRTRGVVRQFSQHYRADKPQLLKRGELFKSLQREISNGFPKDLQDLLKRSKDGIRVISDAHIEWLDVDGVPLGLRFNVSRIPVTPGNLFIGTLAAKPDIFVHPDSLCDVLVISGLEEADVIARQFSTAFDVFGKQWSERLKIKFVRAKSRHDLIDAINNFSGMILMFDGHGSHNDGEPGVLWLGDEAVDVWKLQGSIARIPPIVILSACDTHAADRNHATVANGFLSLGARSVLGSVFPLHASHAAMFAARLLYRVSDYIPAAVGMFKRSITWLEVVSGMLRRQLITDILRHLIHVKLLSQADFVALNYELSEIIEFHDEDPFLLAADKLIHLGVNEERLRKEMHIAIANSSMISYLHVGRPETIIINSKENLENIEVLI